MRMLHIRKYDSAHQARHNAIIGFTMGAYNVQLTNIFQIFTPMNYMPTICVCYMRKLLF